MSTSVGPHSSIPCNQGTTSIVPQSATTNSGLQPLLRLKTCLQSLVPAGFVPTLFRPHLIPAGMNWALPGAVALHSKLFRRDVSPVEPTLKPTNIPSGTSAHSLRPAPIDEGSILAHAALHSLGWLFASNVIGIWLAILLLFPNAGRWLGEWSYGRWIPVHLNWQLYGWMALPLVGWLIRIYGADRGPIMAWSRAALSVWSLALALGALSWLEGGSSGKLFLDWSGFVRIFFPLAILFLWFVLVGGLKESWRSPDNRSLLLRFIKVLGLIPLLLVPFDLYLASNPAIYPAFNPDTGGPTGASQLQSTLIIVLILFLLPYGLTHRKPRGGASILACWIVFAVEAFLCIVLLRARQTSHLETVTLAGLLIWVPLVPAYFHAFEWPRVTRLWRIAALAWWALLVPAGHVLFLPGILDRLKFTDGLVAHSILAMAGFASSLLVLLLAVLLGEDGCVFNTGWAFIAWHGATLAYVVLFLFAGWREGADPSFTIVPGTARNIVYALRLFLGLAMTAASAEWLRQLMSRMPGQFVPIPHPFTNLVPKPWTPLRPEDSPLESRPFARFIAEDPEDDDRPGDPPSSEARR